ncbi:hypothetical protein CERSUDRAFT_117895 [Gelatoporia subvermispora B]|uniref:Uncharacterized protein n=1 Tax=Ceriporiopsis subvermispora (strain B) TaxID=914234 RepID=M2QA75_CERS8|nr:hypothetical protein CERSUDRAFT_117895 [Gelatoporia subvermispora B]
MSFSNNAEQLQHDRVNLQQLVRRLEKTVASEDWATDDAARPAWIKTRVALQKLKYARRLLRNVELYEVDAEATSRYELLRSTLDRLENVVLEVDKRVAPKVVRPEPILPTLPVPISRAVEPPAPSPAPAPESPGGAASPAADESLASISAQDLLLGSDPSPTRPAPVPSASSSTLLPSTLPKFADKSASAAPALQNSAALHEELSAQLAQMTAQLKRNTLHFSSALENDKAFLEGTQEKLEKNYDVMTKERVRLRDHRSKSWGTTWIVMLSVIVAAVGFVLTFFVIRLT